jgi:hypothetical protein
MSDAFPRWTNRLPRQIIMGALLAGNVMHGAFQKDQHLRNEFLTRLS